jgi:hypothetical protein
MPARPAHPDLVLLSVHVAVARADSAGAELLQALLHPIEERSAVTFPELEISWNELPSRTDEGILGKAT